jgi:hypothetical protein
MTLEELDFAFVLFRSFSRPESAEVATTAGLGIALP